MTTIWKKIKENAIFLVLLGIVCIYFGAIVLINFSGRPSFYNTDMYTDMLFAARAWECKSLFPEGWLFGNQLYIVATPALAALCHVFTKDPQIAMAMASCVYSVLVAAGFDWMIRPVIREKTDRLLGLVVFMTLPLFFGDSVGTENGWQLFFTMCSYYACYIFNVFLAFGCYIRSGEIKKRRFQGILTLTCVISFCTGMQSLRQTAVMTAPLVVLAVLRVFWCVVKKENWKEPSLLVAGLISGSNLLGYISRNFIHFEQTEIFGELAVAQSSGFFSSLGESFLTMLDLLRCNTSFAAAVLVVLLVLVVLAAVEFVHRERKQAGAPELLILLTFGVLAIGFVDVVTTIFVRQIYYFLLYPLIGFLAAYGFSRRKKLMRWLLLSVMVVTLVLFSMLALKDICMQAYFAKYDIHHEISEYMLDNGYTTLYSGWNHGEKIAVSSDFRIDVGFWDNGMFRVVNYLCDPEIYEAESDKCVYMVSSAFVAELLVQTAAQRGTELTLLHYFPNCDTYLYTAPVNLMQIEGKIK